MLLWSNICRLIWYGYTLNTNISKTRIKITKLASFFGRGISVPRFSSSKFFFHSPLINELIPSFSFLLSRWMLDVQPTMDYRETNFKDILSQLQLKHHQPSLAGFLQWNIYLTIIFFAANYTAHTPIYCFSTQKNCHHDGRVPLFSAVVRHVHSAVSEWGNNFNSSETKTGNLEKDKYDVNKRKC